LKIVVDHNLCTGQARCWATAEELFPLDDEGYSAVQVADVPPGDEQQARDGAAACPERAISIVED